MPAGFAALGLHSARVRADTKIREGPAAGAARVLRADAGSFPPVVAGDRRSSGPARMAWVARDLDHRGRALVGARGASRRAGRGRRGIGARSLGGGHLGPGRLSGHRPSPAGPIPRPPRQPGRLPAAAIRGHQRRGGLRGRPDPAGIASGAARTTRQARPSPCSGSGSAGSGRSRTKSTSGRTCRRRRRRCGRYRRVVSSSATPNTPPTMRGRTIAATALRPAGATRRWMRSDSSVASNLRSPG